MFKEPIERKAVRILFILRFCGADSAQLQLFGPQYAIESEKKLQKLQFWVRNPDYLAYTLLAACQPGKKLADRQQQIRNVVYGIFQEREPIFRVAPMQKYFHGAYEPLDRVMSLLIGKGLVSGRRQQVSYRSTYFYLTDRGEKLVEQMLQDCDETHWYRERCLLIHSFWGHLSGNEIADIQYDIPVYKHTRISDILQPVATQVRTMFKDLFGEDLPEDEY